MSQLRGTNSDEVSKVCVITISSEGVCVDKPSTSFSSDEIARGAQDRAEVEVKAAQANVAGKKRRGRPSKGQGKRRRRSVVHGKGKGPGNAKRTKEEEMDALPKLLMKGSIRASKMGRRRRQRGINTAPYGYVRRSERLIVRESIRMWEEMQKKEEQ